MSRISRAGQVLAVAALVAAGAVSVPADVAHAADLQRVCNSSKSKSDFDVKSGSSRFTMYVGRCENLPRGGSTLYLTGKGYRVGYDKHDYSECRYNSTPFTPYKKADLIYFKIYDRYDCTNY